VTDFITLSISSTDYIGHNFGPNSIEMEDTYYRLDNDIADFLQYLDTKFGKGNYLVFLTADHGAAHVPAFSEEHELPGGLTGNSLILKDLNASLEQEFGLPKIVQMVVNYQVYLNTAMLEKNLKDVEAVKQKAVKLLKARPDIINAFATDALEITTLPQTQKIMMANGYTPKRSGDLMFTLEPGYIDWGMKGTTHGSWNPYDAHIPNVWFGWRIPHGQTYREVYMTDIAPTVAALLNIQMPSGSVGKVLVEIAK
jgi:arylsulfatase A-like enzyme